MLQSAQEQVLINCKLHKLYTDFNLNKKLVSRVSPLVCSFKKWISSGQSGWGQVQGAKRARVTQANCAIAVIISNCLYNFVAFDVLAFNLPIISHCHMKPDSKCWKGLVLSAFSFLTITEKLSAGKRQLISKMHMLIKETCFCYARWNGAFSYCLMKWGSTRGSIGNACVPL